MKFLPLTDEVQITRAADVLKKGLKKNCSRHEKFIGWQGGGSNWKLYWNGKIGLWNTQREKWRNRYIFCFGTDDPTSPNSVNIMCEINPPTKGINRRVGGLFLQDGNGNLYLAHTGKVGGGRKGIGKNAFINYASSENWKEISWPDGSGGEAIVIGRLSDEQLPFLISHFVRKVDEFKKSIDPTALSMTTTNEFAPEFGGKRAPFVVGEIESEVFHGPVVSALAEQLRLRSLIYGNDRARDLYIMDKNKKPQVLFEVKTNCSTGSIYSAVGQLMLHGIDNSPKRVLVAPNQISSHTRKRLDVIGISLLTYEWVDNKPLFDGLNRVLNS